MPLKIGRLTTVARFNGYDFLVYTDGKSKVQVSLFGDKLVEAKRALEYLALFQKKHQTPPSFTAISKCHPDDKFCLHYGVRIAATRVLLKIHRLLARASERVEFEKNSMWTY
jgi:hypothetical protein